MGIAVLIILICLEIGLCAWTMAKHREGLAWKRDRLAVSLVQWGVIAMIMLLPFGNKGLRFAACFAILSIRLLIFLIQFFLMRKMRKLAEGQGNPEKQAGKAQGKARRIFATVLSCLLIMFSLFPAFLFTGYQSLPTTGEYEVQMVSAILTDEARIESFETDQSHREVPIYVFYPVEPKAKGGAADVLPDGKFPLVLFSHGAFGFYASNLSTYQELASHGYIVISMDHPYHSFYTKDTSGKIITVNRDFMQSVMNANATGEDALSEEKIFETSREWMKLRIEDVSFVLDEVERQIGGESAADGGKGVYALGETWHVEKDADAQLLGQILARTDADKIGVMGHSLGGATSVTIGRTRSDVKAVIDLDGTMLGEELSFENGEYQYYDEAYPIPLLAINNEEHQEEMERYGTLYVNGTVLANAKDASYTYFKGSEHMNFTDLPLFSPFLASKLGMGSIDAKECIQTTNGIVLQFFDHYLKGQGEFAIRESY